MKSKFLHWFVVIIGVFGLSVFYIQEINIRTQEPPSSDFFKFYLSAQRLLENQNIYKPDLSALPAGVTCSEVLKNIQVRKLDEVKACLGPNLNPPIFVVLTAPLGLLDYSSALWVWSVISVFSAVLAIKGILNSPISPVDSVINKFWVGIGFFCYYPCFITVQYGQVTFFMLLCLVLSWLALRQNAEIKAGIWLGLCASIKPFIGVFFVALLILKAWKVLVSSGLTMFILFLVGGLVTGFGAYEEYFNKLGSITWHSSHWNASFTGFFYRLLGGSNSEPWIYAPEFAKALINICSVLTMIILMTAVVRLSKLNQADRADCLYMLLIPIMLILSPLGWIYYFPFIFISILMALKLTKSFENKNIYRLLIMLFLALTIKPNPFLAADYINTPVVWFWDAGAYFYALLLVVIIGYNLVFNITGMFEINKNFGK